MVALIFYAETSDVSYNFLSLEKDVKKISRQ